MFNNCSTILEQSLESSPRDLSNAAEISPSRASFHLRKLERAGVVVRRKGEGPKYAVENPDKVKALLRAYQPMPDQVDGLLDLWDAFMGGE